MSIMQWTEDLSVGVTEIDYQHKALINIINKIHSCYSNEGSRDNLISLLPELSWYAGEHFKNEEEFMENNGYPDLEQHKQIHASMLRQLGQLIAKCQNGNNLASSETSEFLKNWLINHIKVEDHKYAKHAQTVKA